MRTRISRRLLPLVVALLAVTVLAAAGPAEGKGAFCPGACAERLPTGNAFDSVTFE